MAYYRPFIDYNFYSADKPTEAELLASDEDMPSGESKNDQPVSAANQDGGNINNDVNNINVNNLNVNSNISNTTPMDTSNLQAVKTEIKLELESLSLNNDSSAAVSATDNVPLDQLVSVDKQNLVVDAGGNDDNASVSDVPAVDIEPMAVDDLDDPDAFGPFTKSHITADIQSDTDRMFYNSFQDQISLLETAIGHVIVFIFFFKFGF